MPVTIEPTFPEWALIIICLVVIFAIDIFKAMQTRFTFRSFKSKSISYEICFIASHHVFMMFNLVRSIILLTFGPMNMIYKYSMFLLPVVFALRDTRVYTILGIPNINPNDSYVRFGRCLNNV